MDGRYAPPSQDHVLRNQRVGQHVELGRLGTPVRGADADQDVFRAGLGVLHDDVEVPIVGKRAGVEQLEFRRPPVAPRVLLHEARVGKRRLRVLVEHLHVGVRRRGVEVEVVLLDVLAVIALAAGEPEEPLLEDRIAPVPEGQREAEPPHGCRRSRRCRPRPSGRRASARGRAGRTPRPSREGCSPRAPCPTGARTGTAPSAASARRGAPSPAAVAPPR